MRLVSFFAIASLSLAAATASASPIVVLSSNPQVATGVNGVVVAGVTYDITFVDNAIDHTFDGNVADATSAANQLIAAFNASTAAFVALQGCCTINQFIVEDAGQFAGYEVTSYGTVGNWQVYDSNARGDGSVAVFTPVTTSVTPEPSTLALLGTGVLGVAGVIRKRLFA